MGFSVSGSVAIISIGVLVAFGVMFPTVIDSSHQVSDAQSTQSERILEQQNTEIHVDRSTWDSDSNTLTVEVHNEGTAALDVDATDVVVDGTYVTPQETVVYRSTEMETGDATTGVWLSGEVLAVEVEVDSRPERVKVVTESGVADATGEIS